MRGAGKSYKAPSGKIITWSELVLLMELEENKTIEWTDSEVTFNSGFKSHVYFRGRNDLTDNPRLLQLVGEVLAERVEQLPCTHGRRKCMIGIPTAGTPLAQVISDLSANSRSSLIGFRLMRSILKEHGKDNMWVGKPELDKHTYITIENVVSTAKAMFQNFERLEQDGYPTHEMFHVIFASWNLGGFDKLKAQGYEKIVVLYQMLDIIAAYVHLERWPQERYDKMARRINAWRNSAE